MAHRTWDGAPLKAASAFANWVPVAFLAAASALSETIVRAGSVNEFPIGLSRATVASPGDPAQVAFIGESAKGVAGASMGAGAPVAVGSVNGILIPVLGSGLSTALGSALGAAGIRWSVGITLKNAVAADVIPVYVMPDQII